MNRYAYIELMTPAQFAKIVMRMQLYWGPKWSKDPDTIEGWYQELSVFPGIFVWQAVQAHLRNEWPPELGQVYQKAEELYAPFLKLERLLGIRDGDGRRLPAGEIQKRLAR